MARPTPSSKPVPAKSSRAPSRGPRVVARKSPIHGRGVFARRDIAKGERVIEYVGRKITWAQADR
jgi:SET domain-containing protein